MWPSQIDMTTALVLLNQSYQDPAPPLCWYPSNRPGLANRTGTALVPIVVEPIKKHCTSSCFCKSTQALKNGCCNPLPTWNDPMLRYLHHIVCKEHLLAVLERQWIIIINNYYYQWVTILSLNCYYKQLLRWWIFIKLPLGSFFI